MKRWMATLTALAGLAAGLPTAGTAQVTVRVQLYWEWGDGGWLAHRSAYASPATVYRSRGDRTWRPRREVVHRRLPRTIRVPPGHMPPRGYCRLWYPGRPPGHQPAPRPCGELFRYGYGGYGEAVILGSPRYGEVHRGPPGRPPGHRGKKGWKGKKRGHRW